jgi:hypothetical protein
MQSQAKEPNKWLLWFHGSMAGRFANLIQPYNNLAIEPFYAITSTAPLILLARSFQPHGKQRGIYPKHSGKILVEKPLKRRNMKKFLKGLGIALGGLIVLVFLIGWILSEPLPQGEEGQEAEALAAKLVNATQQLAWNETRYVSWNFDHRQQLLWDREKHFVQVKDGDIRVVLNTKTQKGSAWENEVLLSDGITDKYLEKAWAYFCNHAFWLNAPGKIYDPGVSRKLVKMKDGSEALLVSYSSGGVTPGDSYLWILDEAGLPVKWKMWVSVLPVGGIEATWEDWKTLPTGALVATAHSVASMYTLHILDIKAGNDLESIGLKEDPFHTLK